MITPCQSLSFTSRPFTQREFLNTHALFAFDKQGIILNDTLVSSVQVMGIHDNYATLLLNLRDGMIVEEHLLVETPIEFRIEA